MTDETDFPEWKPTDSNIPQAEPVKQAVIDFNQDPQAGSIIVCELIHKLLQEAPFPITKANEVMVALHFIDNMKKMFETAQPPQPNKVVIPKVPANPERPLNYQVSTNKEGQVVRIDNLDLPPTPKVSQVPGEGMARLAAYQEAKKLSQERRAAELKAMEARRGKKVEE